MAVSPQGCGYYHEPRSAIDRPGATDHQVNTRDIWRARPTRRLDLRLGRHLVVTERVECWLVVAVTTAGLE
jgi:hypothetical protein